MNYISKPRHCLAAVAAFLLSPAALAVNASSTIATVYQVAISQNADCTNPTVIFSSVAGKRVDLVKKPYIGGGFVNDGTYRCLMMTVANSLVLTPSSSALPGCVAGTPFVSNPCLGGTTDLLDVGSTTATSTACSSSGKVTIYASTSSLISNPNSDVSNCVGNGDYSAFRRPTSDTAPGACRGILLAGAMTVAGSKSTKFYFDVGRNGGLYDDNGACDMDTPVMGFK